MHAVGDACRGGRSKGLRSRVSARAPSRIPASPGCGEARAARRRVRTRHTTCRTYVLTSYLLPHDQRLFGERRVRHEHGACIVSAVRHLGILGLEIQHLRRACGTKRRSHRVHSRARACTTGTYTNLRMHVHAHVHVPDACACARYAPPVRAEAGASTRALPYSRRSAQPAR
jgi:hypothetical protein